MTCDNLIGFNQEEIQILKIYGLSGKASYSDFKLIRVQTNKGRILCFNSYVLHNGDIVDSVIGLIDDNGEYYISSNFYYIRKFDDEEKQSMRPKILLIMQKIGCNWEYAFDIYISNNCNNNKQKRSLNDDDDNNRFNKYQKLGNNI